MMTNNKIDNEDPKEVLNFYSPPIKNLGVTPNISNFRKFYILSK